MGRHIGDGEVVRDERVGEGGVGQRDEQKLNAGAGPGDAEPAPGSASGREGSGGLDQAHAERERQGEVAELGSHGLAPAEVAGMLPRSRAISRACATSGGM